MSDISFTSKAITDFRKALSQESAFVLLSNHGGIMSDRTFKRISGIADHERNHKKFIIYSLWLAPNNDLWICPGKVTLTVASTKIHSPHRPSFSPGLYEHFKGNYYTGVGLARMIGTGKWYVVYMQLEDTRGIYFRPCTDFKTTVTNSEGKTVRRFEQLHEF